MPVTSLLGRLAEWLAGTGEPDESTGAASVSRWLAANCEYAGVWDMAGMSAFCGQLREIPDALISADGELKSGLLIQIPLEEYAGMLASNQSG